MAKRKRDAIDAAFQSIIGGEPEDRAEVQKARPVSVKLAPDDLEALDAIAGELGVSRHALMRYAIQRLILQWRQGWRPKLKTVTQHTLSLED